MRTIYLSTIVSILGILSIDYLSNNYSILGFSLFPIAILSALAFLDYSKMKIYILTPVDLAEIQTLAHNGQVKESIILTLRRAYGMSEEKALNLSKADVVEMLAKLNRLLSPVPEVKPSKYQKIKKWVFRKLE